MNGTQPVRLLADLGKVAAVNRLKELADQGMYVFQDERFALCLAKHALRTRSLDATVDLYPLWRGQRKYCDDSGIFAEMHRIQNQAASTAEVA